MIENLFIIILSLSVLILITGIFARLISDNRAFSVLTLGSGLLLMFLSIIILGEGFETQTTEEIKEVYIYGENYTGYHFDRYLDAPPTKEGLNLFHKNVTTTQIYEPVKSIYTWGLGFILLLLSLFLMFFSVFDLATSGENEKGV